MTVPRVVDFVERLKGKGGEVIHPNVLIGFSVTPVNMSVTK